jgi:hypothetical protein
MAIEPGGITFHITTYSKRLPWINYGDPLQLVKLWMGIHSPYVFIGKWGKQKYIPSQELSGLQVIQDCFLFFGRWISYTLPGWSTMIGRLGMGSIAIDLSDKPCFARRSINFGPKAYHGLPWKGRGSNTSSSGQSSKSIRSAATKLEVE